MNEALLAFLDREIIYILKGFHYNILNKNLESQRFMSEMKKLFAFANKEAFSCLGFASYLVAY